MKTKIDRLRESWVPVGKRAPDLNSDYQQVEVWHRTMKESFIWTLPCAVSTIKTIRGEKMSDNSVSYDRLVSHWRYVVPPC